MSNSSHALAAQDTYNNTEPERLIEASLAVAYEQRTANLIALWSNPEIKLWDLSKGREVTANIGTEIADKLLQQIIERLGLTE